MVTYPMRSVLVAFAAACVWAFPRGAFTAPSRQPSLSQGLGGARGDAGSLAGLQLQHLQRGQKVGALGAAALGAAAAVAAAAGRRARRRGVTCRARGEDLPSPEDAEWPEEDDWAGTESAAYQDVGKPEQPKVSKAQAPGSLRDRIRARVKKSLQGRNFQQAQVEKPKREEEDEEDEEQWNGSAGRSRSSAAPPRFIAQEDDEDEEEDLDLEEGFGFDVKASSQGARPSRPNFIDEDSDASQDEDWDDDENDFDLAGFRFQEFEDVKPVEEKITFGPESVFAGMDGEEVTEEQSEELALSLLYDDFEVKKKEIPPVETSRRKGETSVSKAESSSPKRAERALKSLEERQYTVTAEGIAVRTLPDQRSPRTGEVLRQGEVFTAVEAVDGEAGDPRLYLRLPEGRGWVFDDAKVYPGFASVKLTSVAREEIVEPEPDTVKRPVIAVIGRPNVGKSTFTNKVCDEPEVYHSIAYGIPGVTRDRAYKTGSHCDSDGKNWLFEMVDTGGLIFFDDEETITFKKEIRHQVDVALQEAVAAIFVVDAWVGVTKDDIEIARYLRDVYVKNGLKVTVCVTKCDQITSMDERTADFWSLGLGEPVPCSGIHGRGIWEVMEKVIDKGSNGLYPLLERGAEPPPSRRSNAISVAIVGKPNVGKSSLLNALVGEERVLTSNIPGTTTDAVDAYLETNEGKTFRFVDTAGIRSRRKMNIGLEWLAVNRSMKAVKRADCCLLMLDASAVLSGSHRRGYAYWSPTTTERYIARQIEAEGCSCIIVLSKWDALENKDEKTQKQFIEAIRNSLAGVGQWAEIITVSSHTGQRLGKLLETIDKTVQSHRKRIDTHIINEVVRDALLWRLPAAKCYNSKQGRIYYATQVSTEPPTICLFCNHPDLFNTNYKAYIENKIRQDLGWFGTPLQLEWRKRTQRNARSQVQKWLGQRLQPEAEEVYR